ncbi:MAG: DsbA family protein [Alphaproteobacteria bacterium]|nr:DsbA family protein [Alphaproteobacteria bacterium]MBU1756676.1 DsbA family protein [Alphaproteobacteria bacterium]
MTKPISLALGALVLTGSVLTGSLLAGSGTAVAAESGKNWSAAVAENENGHLLGNPEAEVKLVEFMSYTCSHCADFARSGDQAIKLAYVPNGRVSFEIRHLLRDPIDLTAALLTHCGDPAKFPANHAAILNAQEDWMAKARATTQAQRSRWQFGSNGARRQAMASDLGFYALMERRGYSRVALDRCLADEAKASALAETSQADVATYNLQGTPSFVVDGELLEGVFTWPALEKALGSRF